MKIALFSSLLLSLFVISCTKADPEAYRGDPILKEFQSQHAATQSQLDAIVKSVESTKKEMKAAVPQSGQFSIHQKKLQDLQSQVSLLNQKLQFFKIRIESRAKEAQMEYLEAFKNKKEWPDKNKVEAFFAEKRLRQAKMQWDQKDRIEQYSQKNSPKPAGGHGEPAPAGH